MNKTMFRLGMTAAVIFLVLSVCTVFANADTAPYVIEYEAGTEDENVNVPLTKLSGISSVTIDGETKSVSNFYQIDLDSENDEIYIYTKSGDGYVGIAHKYGFDYTDIHTSTASSICWADYALDDLVTVNGYAKDDDHSYVVIFSGTVDEDDYFEIDGKNAIIIRSDKIEEQEPEESVDICELTVAGKEVILENGTVNPDLPAGVSYDPASRTLTLNNCTIDYNNPESEQYIQYSSGQLNIELIGDNVLKGAKSDWSYGIFAGGPLTISGSGSLTVDMSECKGPVLGIIGSHRIIVDGCKLTVTGGNASRKGMFYGLSLQPQMNIMDGFKNSYIGIKNADVNINNTNTFTGDNAEKIINIGIDSQDADLLIENSRIQLTLSGCCAWGFGTGLNYDRAFGGKLSIDDKSWVTIKLLNPLEDSDNLYSAYYFEDDIKSKYIYVGDAGGEAKKADRSAIQKHTWIDWRSECTNQFLEFAPEEKTHSNPVIPANSNQGGGSGDQEGSGSGSEGSGNQDGSGNVPGGSGNQDGSGNVPGGSGSQDGSGNGTPAANGDSRALGWITKGSSSYIYDGKVHRPTIGAFDTSTYADLVEGTDFTVVFGTDGKSIGEHYAVVTFIGAYSDCGQDKVYYYINPSKAAFKSVKPGKRKAKIVIKPVKGGVRYKVAYRIKGTKKWKYKVISKPKFVLKKLKSKKKYQIKVYAFKTVSGSSYMGKWSKVKTFKVR